jgi:hypothetical protein
MPGVAYNRRASGRRRYQLERTPLRAAPGMVTLGSDYGGWRVPGGLIGPGWICYCVGAGGDVSFDLELIRRYGATVRAVDPVPGYVRRQSIRRAASRGSRRTRLP